MVNLQSPSLDRTFAALSDPTRRALVMRLAAEPDISVSTLAAPFAMSLPAVMKHLDVLTEAGLVSRTKTGRVVACRLEAEPMRDAFEWLHRYQKFWSERLDRLVAFLEEETWPPKPPPSQISPSQVSPSGAASTRRRRRSSPPGPTRKK